MKKYAVSLVFKKETISATNIRNVLQIVDANSSEEAFGIAMKSDKVQSVLDGGHVYILYTEKEIVPA